MSTTLTAGGRIQKSGGTHLVVASRYPAQAPVGPVSVLLRLAGITAGGDHTAFLDGVAFYQNGNPITPNPLANINFSSPVQAPQQFTYVPSGTVNGWLFSGPLCGVAAVNSAFSNEPSPAGDPQCGFLQNESSAFSQTIQLLPGTYQLRFYIAQRFGNEQRVQVSINGTVVAIASPPFGARWVEYFTPPFTI